MKDALRRLGAAISYTLAAIFVCGLVAFMVLAPLVMVAAMLRLLRMLL